ncbi:hypothetical protein LIA77_03084 [Sarocladium implicatum]|nr:hypothetical protein LIA77_03084 [Sarocladium implicatum]
MDGRASWRCGVSLILHPARARDLVWLQGRAINGQWWQITFRMKQEDMACPLSAGTSCRRPLIDPGSRGCGDRRNRCLSDKRARLLRFSQTY